MSLTPPAGAKAASPLKIIFFAAKIILALSLIVWIAADRRGSFLTALDNFNILWLAPAALLYVAHMFAIACRWKILLKAQGIGIEFKEVFSLAMQGYFFSMFLPGGAIGGDVVKAAIVTARAPAGEKLDGAFSIFMDRWTGMIALFSLCSCVCALYFSKLRMIGGFVEYVVLILALGSAAGLASAVFVMFIHKIEKIKPAALLIALADKFSRGFVSRMTAAIDAYRRSAKTLVLCVLISIIFVHLNLAFVFYLILCGASGGAASFPDALLSMTVGNTAAVVPVTPSGLGARDCVAKDILAVCGVNPSAAAAAVLVNTAVIVFFNLAGGIFFMIDAFKRKRASPAPPDRP